MSSGVYGDVGASRGERLGRAEDLSTEEKRNVFFSGVGLLALEESAQALCRSSVAALTSDASASDRMCGTLEYLAEKTRSELIEAYSEHARGSYLSEAACDHTAALRSFKAARLRFRRTGEDQQAAISMSNALASLALLGEWSTHQVWAREAREYFLSTGDSVRIGSLDNNVAHGLCLRCEYKEAARLLESSTCAEGVLPRPRPS